jgi:Fic family protein
MPYVWQAPAWPKFTYDSSVLLGPLSSCIAKQAVLVSKADDLRLEDQGEALVDEALQTSRIEGEKLDPDSVRSSVARRLGLSRAGLPENSRAVDGLVEILINATRQYAEPITAERLWGWHAALFPTGYSGPGKITVGQWRSGPMAVISGTMGRERVHFEAPPAARVPEEMRRYVDWLNGPASDHPLLFAGIAHLYFVTIHPFEDGNGRIARAITDWALARSEATGKRLYAMSPAIRDDRGRYYEILESTQKGTGDATAWLVWFLTTLEKAVSTSLGLMDKALTIGRFHRAIAELDLNERQRKVVGRLLEALPRGFEGGLTNRKYVSMTKASPATAKRDLLHLEKAGVLIRSSARGRSTHYELNPELL